MVRACVCMGEGAVNWHIVGSGTGLCCRLLKTGPCSSSWLGLAGRAFTGHFSSFVNCILPVRCSRHPLLLHAVLTFAQDARSHHSQPLQREGVGSSAFHPGDGDTEGCFPRCSHGGVGSGSHRPPPCLLQGAELGAARLQQLFNLMSGPWARC